MHSFEVHSNESVCRKSGRLRLDQVIGDNPDTRIQFEIRLEEIWRMWRKIGVEGDCTTSQQKNVHTN